MGKHKNAKAADILKLLKKGMSTKDITDRMAVSYSYVWKLRKELEAAANSVLELVPSMEVKPGEFIETGSVNAVLNERAKNYGTFYDLASLAQGLKNTLMAHLQQQNKQLVVDQQEALEFILSKIARIANGDHNYVDNWVDIAGYAQLVAERLQGKGK